MKTQLEYRPRIQVRYDIMTGEKLDSAEHFIYDSNNEFVALANNYHAGAKELTEKLVKSYNLHDELVNTIEEIISDLDQDDLSTNFDNNEIIKIKNLLNRAKGNL